MRVKATDIGGGEMAVTQNLKSAKKKTQTKGRREDDKGGKGEKEREGVSVPLGCRATAAQLNTQSCY